MKIKRSDLRSTRKINKDSVVLDDKDARIKRPEAGTAHKTKDFTLKDFRGADYNPRFITDKRLANLGQSMTQFGDLSGVVYNASKKRKVLISGHQRIKAISGKGWTHKIVTNPKKDAHGTVATGHIEAKSPTGEVIQIPLRIVAWDDKKCEMAANVAANAHGGDFDKKKLHTVLEALRTDISSFNISLIGIDPLTVKTLPATISMENKEHDPSASTARANGESGSFKTISPEDVQSQLKHKCPRCGFLH